MIDTEAEARTSMLRRYCRWIGDTERKPLSLMSSGASPGAMGRRGWGV